ncbi:MAG TPA: hypothetical protein VMV03_05255 [Spirochaetia bacterium]|nr:hypothetical protein [Spirochaetia bacterium]
MEARIAGLKAVSFYPAPPTQSWRKALVCYAGPLLITTLLAAGQFVFAAGSRPPCTSADDSYVVLQSSFEYEGASELYARSIYNGVREILSGFLASKRDCFFSDAGHVVVDPTNHLPNTLLDLHCEVKRDSSNVLLSVRIDVHETSESLLSFLTSAPFCHPAAALNSFALAFPEAFAGQVVQEYSYPLSPPGYLSKGLGLSLDNVIDYSFAGLADLERDVSQTEDVAANAIQSIRDFKTRRTTEAGVFFLGVLALAGAVAASEYYATSPGGLSQDAKTWLWRIGGAGLLIMIGTAIEVEIFPPRKLTTALNGLCGADAPEK